MNNLFLENNIDINSNIKQEGQNELTCLFENNIRQIKEIEDFLKSDSKMLVVNGFMGVGKRLLLNKILTYLKPNTIILDYTCFETTILDDILLEFFYNFRKLSLGRIIQPPKVKSENFIQKINSYFETIDNPIIVRINSFQNILKNNADEIIKFINIISKFPNVKIIISSRKQIQELSDNICRVTLLAMDKHIFEKYLKSEDLKTMGPIADELYKYTKGYWLYTTLAIRLIKLRKMSLINFISGYTKSMLPFGEFIFREALNLVDPVSGHLFRFLAVMRHPVSISLLKTLNLYDEDKIKFFQDNLILQKINELISLPDFYKVIAQNSISENILIKIHKACVELYETQLPLKPLERDLVISRNTMRNEIDYHKTFIPQRQKNIQNQINKIQLVNYQPLSKYNQDKEIYKQQESHEVILEKSKEALKKVSFIFDENALENIAESINSFVAASHEDAITQEEINDLKLVELMNLIVPAEENYDYKKVIAICQKALTLSSDKDFHNFLPTIYTKLGETYKKISDWFNAAKYYELATDIFDTAGNIEKSSKIKLEIANICFMTFKKDRAKDILRDIVNTDGISETLILKSILLYVDLLDNDYENIKIYFKSALQLQTDNIPIAVLSELYYKWAVFNDNMSNFNVAIEYYKKCINLSKNINENPYLSSVYSNVSVICEENGKIDYAIRYATESLNIDNETKNYDGIYNSSMRLAQLYSDTNSELKFKYLDMAKSAAEALDEPFYLVSVDLTIGDSNSRLSKYEEALNNYNKALDAAKSVLSDSEINRIKIKIANIRSKIGEEKFSKIINNSEKGSDG